MLNFVCLRSSRLHFLHFWLDSCIVNKREKFEHRLGYWMHLEGFQVASSHFWALLYTGLTGQSAGLVHMLRTGLTGGVVRSDRSELSWCDCPVFVKWFACIRLGGVALVQEELACVQGELFVFFELWFGGLRSLLEHSFVLDVSSFCPCLRGLRLVFFKWSFSLPFFGFRSLVGVFLFNSFLFFFSQVTVCVCCQCTHQGGDWGPCVVRGPMDGRFLVWW
jgi:hypothetical protein